MRIALLCGGPSQERGISLNSARSVMDHLASSSIELLPLYVDEARQCYSLSPSQLYSNTPLDFDFKLHQESQPLSLPSLKLFLQQVDLVFSVIHGNFGEDGELQQWLEHWHIPFIGSGSRCCRQMFRKDRAAQCLQQHGFSVLPQYVVEDPSDPSHISSLSEFFHRYQLHRVVVKPCASGSSIGVQVANSLNEAIEAIAAGKEPLLVEPFQQGREFTVVLLENPLDGPIALMPTEIELRGEEGAIFDFRRKYLPTNQVFHHTPPRFSSQTIRMVRQQAEQLFRLFGMRDMARLDGWILEGEKVYFSDFNPLSGLEQNSFFFQQSAHMGMTHSEALVYVLKNAAQRYGFKAPELHREIRQHPNKRPVYVLFGNRNAERQVSLMSGINVWLKLQRSSHYHAIPLLWGPSGTVWHLPYEYTLYHTVEEIESKCQHSVAIEPKEEGDRSPTCSSTPFSFSLEELIATARHAHAFLFLALHGAEGENGTLQHLLELNDVPFNGSNAVVSALCMDKYKTGEKIRTLNDPDLTALPKYLLSHEELMRETPSGWQARWEKWCKEEGVSQWLIKPRDEGCSAGIAALHSPFDLIRYVQCVRAQTPLIPPGTFPGQEKPIEMPTLWSGDCLIEPYLAVDRLFINQDGLQVVSREGWVELTIGVLEEEGEYRAFSPSLTLAEHTILTLEEKFQGGTGINLTPPPSTLFSDEVILKIKRLSERAACCLGIENYCRLDLFFNRFSEKMVLIEANTLPALTPSTVLYHQAWAEDPPISPIAFLEHIITSRWKDKPSYYLHPLSNGRGIPTVHLSLSLG